MQKAGKHPRVQRISLERQIQEDGGRVTLLDSEEDSQSEEEIELEENLCNLHLNGPAPAMQSQGRLRLKVPNMASMKICPLQQGLRATWAAEDTLGFKLFPIFEQLDEQNQNQNAQIHATIPFKILKELKFACSTYGPNSPFVQNLIESVCSEALLP